VAYQIVIKPTAIPSSAPPAARWARRRWPATCAAPTSYLASRKPGSAGPVIGWNGHGMNALVPASSQQGSSYTARRLYPALSHALAW